MAAADLWQRELKYLKGVGPVRAEALAEHLGLRTYWDLLQYFPFRYERPGDHIVFEDLTDYLDQPVTLEGELMGYRPSKGRGRRRLTATLTDGTHTVDLLWFQGLQFVQKRFPAGTAVRLHGKPQLFRNRIQFTHPELSPATTPEDNPTGPRPVYHSTERLKALHLDSRGIAKLTRTLLDAHATDIPESLPPDLLQERRLVPAQQALSAIHYPATEAEVAAATERLKFEELFFFELLLAQRRLHEQPQRPAPPFARVGDYLNRFYRECLPFELTGAQKRVIKEIRADLALPTQMNRLVQGDVGSGKTIVALMTALLALDNGFQVALMAPTEILAEQHYRSFTRNLDPLGVRVDLIIGSQKTSKRKQVLRDLLSGHTHILIGTHALIEPTVRFQNLGLSIIDEQHKFGVMQRAKLWQKHPNRFPHNLVLTATPIPRTLAMTAYGDIDVSVIDELPPGRQPIITALRTEQHRNRVLGFVEEQLNLGRQAYFVYPLVQENHALDLIAVEEGYEALTRRFKRHRVGIVHGKMKPEAKEYEMQRFVRGESHVLVSTTVIEVGVDVPNATVMVVENANRFGLSQLHQLRGRVGRGGGQSFCILLTPKPPTGTAKERLQALAETTDGFRIAEVDLRLRGPGDFLGTRQSGLPEFKLADLSEDRAVVIAARDAAFARIRPDAGLENPENLTLRQHLHLFLKRHNLQAVWA